jgi:DNA-binding ferritin-like protein (Dps family)
VTDWDALRALFDETGLQSVEAVVANGVPPEVAGARVARFNDMLIERLKEAEMKKVEKRLRK